MLTTVFKMAKAAVLAAVVTDLVIDAAKSIYEWNVGRTAEKRWNNYIETAVQTRLFDPIEQNIN